MQGFKILNPYGKRQESINIKKSFPVQLVLLSEDLKLGRQNGIEKRLNLLLRIKCQERGIFKFPFMKTKSGKEITTNILSEMKNHIS